MRRARILSSFCTSLLLTSALQGPGNQRNSVSLAEVEHLLRNLSETDFYRLFRCSREEVDIMCAALAVKLHPNAAGGCNASPFIAMCVLLNRFMRPNRLEDIGALFSRWASDLRGGYHRIIGWKYVGNRCFYVVPFLWFFPDFFSFFFPWFFPWIFPILSFPDFFLISTAHGWECMNLQ